jgi:hypothetical protein
MLLNYRNEIMEAVQKDCISLTVNVLVFIEPYLGLFLPAKWIVIDLSFDEIIIPNIMLCLVFSDIIIKYKIEAFKIFRFWSEF